MGDHRRAACPPLGGRAAHFQLWREFLHQGERLAGAAVAHMRVDGFEKREWQRHTHMPFQAEGGGDGCEGGHPSCPSLPSVLSCRFRFGRPLRRNDVAAMELL